MLVQPTWSADEDALLLAHAGEPARAIAPLFERTLSAIYQRRATLRRGGRA